MKVHEQFLNVVERFFPQDYFQKENKNVSIASLLEDPLFKEFRTHSPALVGILNNVTMGYEFLSDNIKDVFGYHKDTFMVAGGVRNVLDAFKEEHAFVYNTYIFSLLYEYFQKCARTKEIAQTLLISDHKVHNHRKNIMEIVQTMSSEKFI